MVSCGRTQELQLSVKTNHSYMIKITQELGEERRMRSDVRSKGQITIAEPTKR